jgi:hypothetical protein
LGRKLHHRDSQCYLYHHLVSKRRKSNLVGIHFRNFAKILELAKGINGFNIEVRDSNPVRLIVFIRFLISRLLREGNSKV